MAFPAQTSVWIARPGSHQILAWSTASCRRKARISIRALHSTAAQAKDSSSSTPSASSSKAAFDQRQILDRLRSSQASSNSSLSNADPKPRFNATAEAALEAAAGGRGGAMPLGMAGLRSGAGAGAGGGLIDRMTGEGKKWKDLKGGEKVARATVQSSRTVFIVGGATLTFVLVYALASELFAKNSPTVVFGDACKRVQKSPVIAEHLLPPLRFHTSPTLSRTASSSPLNPPPSGRRSRSVTSYTYTDPKDGKEHMLLRFFVEARDKDTDLTLWDRARAEIIDAGRWAGRKIQEGGEWVGDQLGLFEDDSAHEQVLPSGEGATSAPDGSRGPSLFSRAVNFSFGSLTGLARGGTDAFGKLTSSRREPGTWSSGEAHAELEKDENGVFQYKHFFVDIPSSSATVRERVWIVRRPGDGQQR